MQRFCGRFPPRPVKGKGGCILEFFLNGEQKDGFTSSLTIADLLEQLKINPKSVVVERNLEIVPRDTMDEETIQNGDRIEIVRIVGGG